MVGRNNNGEADKRSAEFFSKKGREDLEDRVLSREALERAPGRDEPAMERLLDAVPAMIEEARRRRGLEAREDLLTASLPLARAFLRPTLAAAGLLFVLATGVAFATEHGTDDVMEHVEALILCGGDYGSVEELVLESAIVPGD